MSGADSWLLVAAGTHLGFQLTVTLVVYPALADLPPERWGPAHDRHSSRITPVVALVYAGLGLATGAALLSADVGAGVVIAAAAAAVCVGLTAVVAAPTHARLGHGHDAALVRRLLVVDRLRLVAATVCLVGALLAV